MADITFISGDVDTDASWIGGVKPGVGDIGIFDDTSGAAEISGDVGPWGGINMTGFTDSFTTGGGAWTLDIDGSIMLSSSFLSDGGGTLLLEVTGNIEVLAGTTFASGLLTIKHNDLAANARTVKTRGLTNAVVFQVNNPGITSLTALEDGGTTILWKSVNITSAAGVKYTDGGFDYNIGGDIIIGNSATVASTGKWTQTVNGNISNRKYTNALAELSRSDGVTTTLIAETFAKKLSGGGTIALVAQTLSLGPAVSNDFYTATCSYTRTTGDIILYIGSDSTTNTAAMNFGTVPVSCGHSSNHRTLTVAGRFTCGTLTLTSSANDVHSALVCNGGLDASGLVTLGVAASTKIGKLTIKGNCSVGAGLVCLGTSVAHELNLNSAYLSLIGTIAGVNAATGAIVPTNIAAEIWGGVLTGCDLSGTNTLYPHGSVDGGGNTNVVFESSPRSMLMLTGAGR